MMSFGMGLTFVPLTLTAVHHVRAEDTGIGSGVLNTMQQVGGALGLATLAHGGRCTSPPSDDRVDRALAPGRPGGQLAREPATARAAMQQAVGFQAAFTNGATQAFLVGAVMMWAASADRVDLPQRQARGAGHRRAPEGVAV